MKSKLFPLLMPAVLALSLSTVDVHAQSPAPTVATPAPPPPAAVPKPKPMRTEATAVTPFNRNPGRHADFLERIKAGPVGLLFLGDSITDFWPKRGEWSWLKFAPDQPADFAVSGERTEDVLWRITNGELDGITPKVTVIMIGTNNFGAKQGEQPEWAAAGVTKIVETVREKLPKTKILLLAIFPRGKPGDAIRGDIDKTNAILAKLDNGKTIRYLDIGHVFLDPDGTIPLNIMPDLLHPTSRGYDRWYAAMRPLLEEMMK